MHRLTPELRLNLLLIAATILIHGALMLVNEIFFQQTEFLKGIGWIYLPAGTRLLCTLLFGAPGAIGLLISGWLYCFFYYFPGDAVRSTMGAFAGAAGPYLVYVLAKRRWGLGASLARLTPARLLWCALGCALASPLLHHLWFAIHGDAHLADGFAVMFIGDLAGTLLVVYGAKAVLAWFPQPALRC
jgi:hypothetical protein